MRCHYHIIAVQEKKQNVSGASEADAKVVRKKKQVYIYYEKKTLKEMQRSIMWNKFASLKKRESV